MDDFTLSNARGMEVRFIAYGGTIVSIRVPDRNGVFADVTPGFDSPVSFNVLCAMDPPGLQRRRRKRCAMPVLHRLSHSEVGVSATEDL